MFRDLYLQYDNTFNSFFDLRQYRTELVRKMRSQIFRQIVQKFRRHTDVCQGIFVRNGEKYASRFRAKPSNRRAKTLSKISVFARLLIVHLRIRHALRSGESVRPFEPKIKPAEPVEFLVGAHGFEP